MSAWTAEWDEALTRLEDFLLSYPVSRALPHLDAIATRAGVPLDFLGGDERAHKVIMEAVGARPLGTHATVEQARLQVELLALEVEVLSERLRDPATSAAELGRIAARLRDARRSVDELRRVL